MPKRKYVIDDLDRRIIALLTEDGRLSASEIAVQIGDTSERTIRNRIAALLESRSIVIGAIPDPTAADFEVSADLLIAVRPGTTDQVAAKLAEFDEVSYLAAMSGTIDLTALVNFDSNADLFEFTENVVGRIDGVTNITINIIIKMYKVYGTRTATLSSSARRTVNKTRPVEKSA